MRQARRLVLITGSPRSGTTTIGDVLGSAPATATIYEPMNFHSGDRCIQRYFEIPGTGGFSAADLDDLTRRMSRLHLRLKSGVWPEDKGLRRLAKYAVGGRSRTSYLKARLHPASMTVLWKDPMAAFAARRLVHHHGMAVVVAYRAPHPVAASFRRMGWQFDLREILPRAQAAGLWVPPDHQDLPLEDPLINAAVLWTVVYAELLDLAQRHRDQVSVVDLEGLITAPHDTYSKVFSRLGLSFDARTKSRLDAIYAPRAVANDGVPGGHAHPRDRDRDPSQANSYWKKLLTNDETAAVSAITQPVQQGFSRFFQG